MKKKAVKKVFVFFLTLIILDCAWVAVWQKFVVNSFSDQIVKTPVAIVLFHDFNKDETEVGLETRRRLNYIVGLYQKKMIDYVLCIGGARPQLNAFGSELMKQFLIDAHVPSKKIISEKKSFDSITNWHVASAILKARRWDQVLIVSSPMHLYRFKNIVEKGHRGKLIIKYSPYSLKQAKPPISFPHLWIQTHYEGLSTLAQLLPDQYYQKLIQFMRSQ